MEIGPQVLCFQANMYFRLGSLLKMCVRQHLQVTSKLQYGVRCLRWFSFTLPQLVQWVSLAPPSLCQLHHLSSVTPSVSFVPNTSLEPDSHRPPCVKKSLWVSFIPPALVSTTLFENNSHCLFVLVNLPKFIHTASPCVNHSLWVLLTLSLLC